MPNLKMIREVLQPVERSQENLADAAAAAAAAARRGQNRSIHRTLFGGYN